MKLHTAIMCGLLLGLFSACGDEKKAAGSDAETRIYSKDTASAVQKMNKYHYSDQIKWGSRSVTYQVDRHSVDSLPLVTDDAGTKYADNVITLTVNQGDRQLFQKTFYKRSFKEYMERDFYEHAILEGMAFDKVKDGNLCFAVGVSYPMSDLYIPLVITLRPDGSYDVAKDLVLDNVVETLDTTSAE